ncbi:hypothetical protein AB0H42_16850 [Nocardia sp. NPDC050799]|uniref:hypothetical protein n=1 Tax=Nocardia sp. NPDC050799 TaxID=3154842 RepID=UPI0033C4CE28
MALLGSPQPRSRRRAAPDTDLLVWTPYACTLVVLADFGSVQHGVLTTGPTGRWQIGDGVADLRTGKATPNPILRGRKVRNELAALFRRHGLSEHIDVLVVLIPKTGSRISWTPPPPEDGIETVLVRIGRSAGLAEYFERAATGPGRWRGEDLARAFEILGAARYLPDPDALDEEGFFFAPGSAAGIRAAAGGSSEPVASGAPRSVAAISAASALLRARGVTGDFVASPRGASAEQGHRSAPPIRHSDAPPAPGTYPERGDVIRGTGEGSADSGEPPIGDEYRPESDAASSAGTRATSIPIRGRTDSDQRVPGTDAGAEDGLGRPAAISAAVASSAARESAGRFSDVRGTVTGRGRGDGVSGGAPAEPRQRHGILDRETGPEPMVQTGSAPVPGEHGGSAAATAEHGGPAAATAEYRSAMPEPAVPEAGPIREGGEVNDSGAGPGRTPVRSALRRRLHAGDSGRVQRSAGFASPPGRFGGSAAAPGEQAVPDPAVAREVVGVQEDHEPDGPAPVESRSAGHGGRDFADPAAAPGFDRGHRIGDRVPAPVRRGLAGLQEIPARARRAAAGPRPAARPPREPWEGRGYGEPARRGRDLRYPAALGLAGVVLAAVTATVFAASGFARFDVTEYGALCAGGEGNSAAAPYSASGPSPVYLGGELAEYTAFGPSTVWRPIDSGAVQLVACAGQERRGDLVHTCQYPPAPGQPVGRTLNLFTAVYRLTVYEARTGSRLAAMEITGDEFGTNPAAAEPDPCRAATGAPEDGLPGRRYSRPSHQQIEQALTPFVAPAAQRIRAAR